MIGWACNELLGSGSMCELVTHLDSEMICIELSEFTVGFSLDL